MAPLRSTRALVATVMPWTIESVRWRRSESGAPSVAASRESASSTPGGLVGRGARRLGERDLSALIDRDHVRERAADIHPHPVSFSRISHQHSSQENCSRNLIPDVGTAFHLTFTGLARAYRGRSKADSGLYDCPVCPAIPPATDRHRRRLATLADAFVPSPPTPTPITTGPAPLPVNVATAPPSVIRARIAIAAPLLRPGLQAGAARQWRTGDRGDDRRAGLASASGLGAAPHETVAGLTRGLPPIEERHTFHATWES